MSEERAEDEDVTLQASCYVLDLDGWVRVWRMFSFPLAVARDAACRYHPDPEPRRRLRHAVMEAIGPALEGRYHRSHVVHFAWPDVFPRDETPKLPEWIALP